jgi:hypothetical protein
MTLRLRDGPGTGGDNGRVGPNRPRSSFNLFPGFLVVLASGCAFAFYIIPGLILMALVAWAGAFIAGPAAL